MERKIVIATTNAHKAREIKSLIGDRYNVLTQDYFSISSVPETGKTFEENALIKANHVAEKTGLLTLADDSGLEVDLLNGEHRSQIAQLTLESFEGLGIRNLLTMQRQVGFGSLVERMIGIAKNG